ncbi:MAG: hypothetical protein ABSH48_02490 [Verrucomicrobiota bacterium]|jgi:hypothetical protein
MQTLNLIQENCIQLAELRGRLRKKFEARQKAATAATISHDLDIRQLQAQCTAARDSLLANLTTARDLFNKPKTREFAGITVGFEKERDSVSLPPDEILVDRIEKMLPAAQSGTLLDRTVTVIKNAFKKLPGETLQRLGCSIVKGGDKAIARANDDDIETLVSKSLGESGKPGAS